MVKMIENYILSDVIGQGSYGTVHKAKHKITQQTFAIKIIPVEKFHQHQKLQQCIVNEIETLTTITQCPHIIRYYEKFKTRNNFYFVYEYCEGGNLQERLKKQGKMKENETLQIFRQLLEAFKILNRHNIMHRDLKPENILFHRHVVKLADFGFCKGMKPDENLTKTMLGSPIYMAPEVLKGDPYTTKADIWSLGVILYECLYGFCPFQSNSIANLISNIDNKPLHLPSEPQVSHKTQNLIKRMLTKDYFRRISWVELFGYKINENGQYVENVHNLAEVSNILEKRSTSQACTLKKKSHIQSHQSFDSNLIAGLHKQTNQSSYDRKPSSLKKEEKKKVFYSQNYMDIFSKPLQNSAKRQNLSNMNTPTKQIDLQTHAETQQPFSLGELPISSSVDRNKKNVESSEYLTNSPEKQKRQKLLKAHEFCVKVISKTLKDLEKKKKVFLSDCYIILKLVHRKLKTITGQIKITETNLLDMASLINYEIIQVDRMIIEIRNELLKEKIDIPQVQNDHPLKSGQVSQELKQLFRQQANLIE